MMKVNVSILFAVVIAIFTAILALGIFSRALAEEPVASAGITLTPTEPEGRVTATAHKHDPRVTRTPYYPPNRVIPGGDGNLELLVFYVILAGIIALRFGVHLLQRRNRSRTG